MEHDQPTSPAAGAGADPGPDAAPRATAADDSTAPPLRIERERLPDGRSITYYSRPNGAGG